MTKKRLFVDMDGTLARFHDQINYIERMFEKDFFRTLAPFENMVAALRLLRQVKPELEIFTISATVQSTPFYCEEEKHLWLDQHLPEIDRNHRLYTEMGRSKAEYIPGMLSMSDYLLDDYNRGLNLFLFGGGSAIKCHNNINQRGLGLHGGSAGHLWAGAMVHTDDRPELIAAELCRHMGLDFPLETVLSAYPDILFIGREATARDIPSSCKQYIQQTEEGRYLAVDRTLDAPAFFGFTDPFNALRFLSGDPDFREYLLPTYTGSEVSATALELRSVCQNVYKDPDFQRYLRADRSQLATEVLSARCMASRPLVGQVHYLNTGGKADHSRLFFSHKEMQEELNECRDYGVPVTEEWFIPPSQVPLNELTDRFQLYERLRTDYGFSEEEARSAAQALLTPYEKRTREQMQELTAIWHTHTIPGDLQTFLRLSDAEMQDYVSPRTPFRQPSFSSEKPPLDETIHHADILRSAQKQNPGCPTVPERE